MPTTWKAPNNVSEMLASVVSQWHLPRLEQAQIGIAFTDTKAYVGDKVNLGRVSKFSDFNKLWMSESLDFSLQICADVWHEILNPHQREAYLDLLLCCCQVDYVPETIVENGKKKTVKDDNGRTKYTNELKVDEDGHPKWKVGPLDIYAFTENVSRYGLWCEPLNEFWVATQPPEEANEG